VSALTIRRAIAAYAAAHSMSFDIAMFASVAALVGWLEGEEVRQERERLAAATPAAPDTEQEDRDERDDR
jgi:hypothetical protein